MIIKLILQIYILVKIIQAELISISSELPYDVQLSEIQGWNQSRTTNPLQTCKGQKVFGPFGSSSNIQKTFQTLPPHYSASVSFEILGFRSIDNGDDVYIKIDNQLMHKIVRLSYWSQQGYDMGCNYQNNSDGWKWMIWPYPIDLNITHTSETLTLKVYDTFNQAIDDEGWSISRLDVIIDSCHQSCLTCDGPLETNCLTCPSGSTKLNNNRCRCDGYTYSKDHSCVSTVPSGYLVNRSNMVLSKKCSNNCQDCTSYYICTTCQAGYYLSHNFCYDTCPSYSTTSGQNCIDTDFDNNNSNLPVVISEDFVNIQFASANIKANNWKFNYIESQTQSSVEYTYTSFSTEFCNGKQLALGYSVFKLSTCDSSNPCQFSKQFTNLPAHHSLQIKVQFWAGGLWSGNQLNIKLDDNIILSKAHTSISGSREFNCGLNENYIDYIFDLTVTEQHGNSDVTVIFEWTNIQYSQASWAAFRDFQLTALQCDPKCASCSDSATCITCIPSRTNAPNCDQAAPGYFDDNLDKIELPQCNIQCAECVNSPDNCTKCRYYDDPKEIPRCNKPKDCLVYGGVRSVGFQHYSDANGIGGVTEFYKDNIKIVDSTKRGINIVQFNQSADFIEHKYFDTCGFIEQVEALIVYINSIPMGNIVMLGIYDEGANYLSQEALDALSLIGWDQSLNVDYRDAYAFIGRKTLVWHAPQAQMLVRDDTPRYAAYVEECLIQCEWQCAECSGTSSNCTKCRYYTATPAPTCGQPTNCLTYVKTESQDNQSGNYYKTYINGSQPSGSTNDTGMNLVIMDGNGTIQEQVSYDTSTSSQDVTDFIDKLNNIPSEQYVILGVKEDASIELNKNSQSYTALQSIGWPQEYQIYQGDPFSLIGKKDATSDQTLWQIGRYTDPGYTSALQCIQDCPIKCATCSSDSTCDTCSSNLRQNDCSLPTNCGKFVYVKSTGFHYSKYQSNGKKIQIFVNDIDITFSQEPGLHFILFDDQGQIDDQQVFNYSQDLSQLTAMISWINNIQSGRKVIIGCNGDMQENMTNDGYIALQSLGLSDQASIDFREPFAMVGEKGSTQGTQQFSTGVAIPGAADISVCALGCQYQCASCQMETYTCLSCSHSTRSSTPDCACNDGKYDVGIPECSTCNYKCASCETSATNCLTCSDTNRVDDGICNCKNGYFNVVTNPTCVQCPQKYETCTDENTGTKCQGENRTTITPDCVCQDGYFDDGNNQSDCLKCDLLCKTCDNTSNYCLSCNDGYYLDGNNCLECPNKFETCSSSTVGIICATGTGRTGIKPDCGCEIGYFDNLTNSNNCEVCDHPCIECQNTSTECTTCHSAANRQDAPNCNCKNGYFEEINQQCLICTSPCLKCVDNTTKCTECINTQFRILIPSCLCEDGYFENESLVCQICEYPCKKCTGGPLICDECVAGSNRVQDNTCRCEDGYFDNGLICEQCDLTKCSTCQNNPAECIICANNTRGGENCDCLQGYFEQGVAQCGLCNYKCETCSGTADSCDSCSDISRIEDSQCLCKDTYYDDGVNKLCNQCLFPCKNCQSKNICLSCDGNFRNLPNCNCIQGYYNNDSNICETCDKKCKLCTNQPDNCLVCALGQFRTLINPQCGCQEGYYQVEETQDCQPCKNGCQQCEDITGICTECSNSNFSLPDCISEIQQNILSLETVNDDNTTQIIYKVCSFQCQTCEIEINNCTKCKLGLNRNQEIPDCNCLQGYHDNKQTTNDCFKCSNTCQTCQSFNECLTCKTSQNRILNPHNFKCECAYGYTEQRYDNHDCVPCLYYKNVCFQECPKNTIQDIKKKQCLDQQFNISNNTQIIIICGVALIFIQILLIFIIKFQFKLKIFKFKKLNQLPQKDEQSQVQEKVNISTNL